MPHGKHAIHLGHITHFGVVNYGVYYYIHSTSKRANTAVFAHISTTLTPPQHKK